MSTLREIREANYISRKQLANLADVSESTIVRIEDPKHRTTYDIAEKVLQALGNKIGMLLTTDTVDGLNLYNIMRDRRQRTRVQDAPTEEVA